MLYYANQSCGRERSEMLVALAKTILGLSGYRVIRAESVKDIRYCDFIPRGESVDITSLVFQPAGVDINFCCQGVGNDIQSGPYYCGDIATVVAHIDTGGTVGLCKKHVKACSTKLKAA